VQAVHPVLDGGGGGQHEHPAAASARDQPCAYVIAARARQISVEHDHVEAIDERPFQPSVAVEGKVNRHLLAAQANADRLSELRAGWRSAESWLSAWRHGAVMPSGDRAGSWIAVAEPNDRCDITPSVWFESRVAGLRTAGGSSGSHAAAAAVARRLHRAAHPPGRTQRPGCVTALQPLAP